MALYRKTENEIHVLSHCQCAQEDEWTREVLSEHEESTEWQVCQTKWVEVLEDILLHIALFLQ